MSEVKTNKISSVSTNGDITLDPDGTGDVVVAAGHKLGIGTSSPDTSLHISAASSTRLRLEDTTNNVKADILVGDTSSVIGNASNHDLAFMTNDVNRMTIDSSGSLLLGTSSKGGSEKLALIGGPAFNMAHASTGTVGVFRTSGISGSIVGSISITGSSTAYNTSSDYRLKENVADMTGAIARVKQLAPKRFNFIADPDDTTVDGFLAHEAQTVVPEAITGTHNEVDADGDAVMQGIDQSKLVPLLTGALREAIAKIETLEIKVAALEAGE
jgi:hypothetical protein